jgi:ParB family transcriptional regulator, chromosome partitioning protein
MAKPQTIKPSAMFADAGQSQQISRLKGQVEELEAEIAELKSSGVSSKEKTELEFKIQSLIQELSETQGVRQVNFKEISRNPLQPRIIFTQAQQQAFSHILREEGQLAPVLLMEMTNEVRSQLKQYEKQGLFITDQPLYDVNLPYLMFDGERRLRSAPLADLKSLKAVIMPPQGAVNLLEIQSKAVSTTIHQKKLHDLELAQVLICQCTHRYPEFKDVLDESMDIELPRALNTALTQLKRRLRRGDQSADLSKILDVDRASQREWLDNSGLEETARAILDVILSYQQNPSTISRYVLPLLKLPDDLKQAVWDEGIEAAKLRLLNQLNAESLDLEDSQAKAIRVRVTQDAIANNWSTQTINEQVKALLAQYNPAAAPEQPKLPREITALENTDFSELSPAQLRECQQILNRRLKEIKQLISQES